MNAQHNLGTVCGRVPVTGLKKDVHEPLETHIPVWRPKRRARYHLRPLEMLKMIFDSAFGARGNCQHDLTRSIIKNYLELARHQTNLSTLDIK